MRQSKLTKVVALMLSLVMVTSVFVGNTLSRYVTSVSSTDNARVAVWGINGKEVTMELFKTDYDLDGKKIAAANQNDDGSYDKIIAPGTGGSSAFSIINFMDTAIAPEVAYQVKIELDDTAVDERIKANSSIQWKLDNNDWGTWEQLVGSLLLLSGDQSGVKVYEPGTFATAFKDNVEHTISWQWALDGNNETDTQMGNGALSGDISAKVTVRVTAQQVDDLTTNAYLIDGANQVVNLNYVQPITLKSSADFGTFESVIVNGNPLTRDTDYLATQGSTVITLSKVYLSNLPVGTYTIEIVSSENTATTNFYVIDDLLDSKPMLASSSDWYQGETLRSSLKTINIVDEASEDIINSADESWAASVDIDGDGELNSDVMCYVDGDTLTIAGNGSGKIYMNYDSSFAFSDKNKQNYFKNLESINNLDLLNTSKVVNMSAMFKTIGATVLDLNSWDTSNVITMRTMFDQCPNLEEVYLSDWNTSNVKDMVGMFQGSIKVKSLDLSNWDVGNVQDMQGMFMSISSFGPMALTSIGDVGNWNTSKLTDTNTMFQYCSNLEELDVSNWDVGNVKNMYNMFAFCDSLNELDVSNWDVSSVKSMSNMFTASSGTTKYNLKNMDFSNWDVSNVEDMSFMFYGRNLVNPNFENWDVSSVKSFDHFLAWSRSTNLDVSKWVTSSATNMNAMFHMTYDKVLDVSNFDTSNVTVFGQMFEYCILLEEIIGLENFDTSKAVEFAEMFNNCNKLKKLNLSSFNTKLAKNNVSASANGTKSATLKDFFKDMSSLKEIVLGPNFSFNGDGSNTTADNKGIFPTPDPTKIPGADGYWYTEDGTAYTPAEIQALPNPAGTYYAVNPTLN